jgi:hypothetical protein
VKTGTECVGEGHALVSQGVIVGRRQAVVPVTR